MVEFVRFVQIMLFQLPLNQFLPFFFFRSYVLTHILRLPTLDRKFLRIRLDAWDPRLPSSLCCLSMPIFRQVCFTTVLVSFLFFFLIAVCLSVYALRKSDGLFVDVQQRERCVRFVSCMLSVNWISIVARCSKSGMECVQLNGVLLYNFCFNRYASKDF